MRATTKPVPARIPHRGSATQTERPPCHPPVSFKSIHLMKQSRLHIWN
jgi:hypothetical protein